MVIKILTILMALVGLASMVDLLIHKHSIKYIMESISAVCITFGVVSGILFTWGLVPVYSIFYYSLFVGLYIFVARVIWYEVIANEDQATSN